jgi:cytochrome c oxidase subunit 3
MIPYTLERRTDTWVSNTRLGFWLFLASEVMLFGALFSAYALLRVSASAWPTGREVLNLPLGAVNTLVLIGVTAAAWRRKAALGSALAVVFLIVKAVEYTLEIRAGMAPAANTFLALYFTLTGIHALHVIGGLIGNAWAAAGRAGAAMTANRLSMMAIYWTFVDAIWLIIFLLLYV